MYVTLFEMIMNVRALHPLKEYHLMNIALLGTIIDVRDVHVEKNTTLYGCDTV